MNDHGSTPPRDPLTGMGRGMLVTCWLLVLGLVTWGFSGWLERERNPNAEPQTQRAGERLVVTLQRNRAEHYVATGTLNGRAVEFLLDTGATDVALSSELAEQLALPQGPWGTVMTANGAARAWRTRIERLTLGGIVLEDVRASVLPGLDDAQVLLGMSALSRLELRQKGDTLTLIQ